MSFPKIYQTWQRATLSVILNMVTHVPHNPSTGGVWIPTGYCWCFARSTIRFLHFSRGWGKQPNAIIRHTSRSWNKPSHYVSLIIIFWFSCLSFPCCWQHAQGNLATLGYLLPQLQLICSNPPKGTRTHQPGWPFRAATGSRTFANGFRCSQSSTYPPHLWISSRPLTCYS